MYKSVRLAKALEEGKSFTPNQIRSRFKIANPSATISDLNIDHGYNITMSTEGKYLINRRRNRNYR